MPQEHDGAMMWNLVSIIETIKPGNAFMHCNGCGNLEKIPAHYAVADVFLEEFFWICNTCGGWREHPKSKISNQGRSIYA